MSVAFWESLTNSHFHATTSSARTQMNYSNCVQALFTPISIARKAYLQPGFYQKCVRNSWVRSKKVSMSRGTLASNQSNIVYAESSQLVVQAMNARKSFETNWEESLTDLLLPPTKKCSWTLTTLSRCLCFSSKIRFGYLDAGSAEKFKCNQFAIIINIGDVEL